MKSLHSSLNNAFLVTFFIFTRFTTSSSPPPRKKGSTFVSDMINQGDLLSSPSSDGKIKLQAQGCSSKIGPEWIFFYRELTFFISFSFFSNSDLSQNYIRTIANGYFEALPNLREV